MTLMTGQSALSIYGEHQMIKGFREAVVGERVRVKADVRQED